MKRNSKHAAHGGATPAALPSTKHDDDAAWMLPAIRGVQAGRLYYALMIRLRSLGAFFPPVDTSLPAEIRSQRALNKARVPKSAEYILGNRDTYTFRPLRA